LTGIEFEIRTFVKHTKLIITYNPRIDAKLKFRLFNYTLDKPNLVSPKQKGANNYQVINTI